MRIALVGSLLLALAAPAAAENWARIGSTGMGETLYIDLGSVSGAGSARTFRYKAVSSDDYSIVTLALDCAAHSFSVQRIEYHAASGGLTDSTDGPFPTADIVPGSTPAALQTVVCK